MSNIEMPKLKFYPDNKKAIKWKCPGLLESDDMLILLHDYCAELEIEQPFHKVYGGITSPWGGGRIPSCDYISEKELFSLVEEYNKRNIICNFTFSNYRIEKQHLDDYVGNLVCKVLSKIDFPNGIIVSSDLLSDYARQKYPSVKQIASMIKPSYEFPLYDETPEYYNNLCEKYDNVCIRPEWNLDIDFLKQLKYKDKIELLVNQVCKKKCEIAREHYDKSVKYSKEDTEAERRQHFCSITYKSLDTIYNHVVNSTEQVNELVKLGFSNIKLKGRRLGKRAQLEAMGKYIFDPTGYFQLLQLYVLNNLH